MNLKPKEAAPRRPPMRYHGAKWRLAPWVISMFPPHRIYVEPFGGAAGVLLRKPRAYSEILNDLDDEVINVFRVLRDPDQAALLEAHLRLTPYARSEFKLAYEEAPAGDPVERARRTLVRSYMGFGSSAVMRRHFTSFRSNPNRSSTTPAHDWASYPDAISAFTQRLAGVVIECRPAIEVMRQYDAPDALHYVDPPYLTSVRSAIRYEGERKCYRHEMTDDDHRELATVLHSLRGMVVLSGYRSPLYDELFGDYQRVEKAAHADGAAMRTECLWLSPATSARLNGRLAL